MYNAALWYQWGKLFTNRWNVPFRVEERLPRGSFFLGAVDGVHLKKRYATSLVKRFDLRGTRQEEIGSDG